MRKTMLEFIQAPRWGLPRKQHAMPALLLRCLKAKCAKKKYPKTLKKLRNQPAFDRWLKEIIGRHPNIDVWSMIAWALCVEAVSNNQKIDNALLHMGLEFAEAGIRPDTEDPSKLFWFKVRNWLWRVERHYRSKKRGLVARQKARDFVCFCGWLVENFDRETVDRILRSDECRLAWGMQSLTHSLPSAISK